MKPTVHFVYAVPNTPLLYEAPIRRMRKHLAFTLHKEYAPWRGGHISYRRKVLAAPSSITIKLLEHLQKSYLVRLYDWNEQYNLITYTPNDIIIGHITPSCNGPMNRMVMSDRPALAKILIQPFQHRLPDTQALIPFIERSDAFAAICGPYWIDTVDQTPFGRYKHKIQRVDMAIDASYYPRVKRTFNEQGKRRLLYIGHNYIPHKGCVYLSRLAQTVPDIEFGWIGNGQEIPGVKHISRCRDLTPEYMSRVCKEYDFLITMGISDANPTTILESMAWGLPVICTPQSGYYNMDTIFNIAHEDDEGNRQLLARLQAMPAEQLESVAARNRLLVTQHYTWQRFCQCVDSVIGDVIQGRHGAGLPSNAL